MNGWLRSRTRLLAAAVFASMFAVATSGSAWAVTYYSQGSLAPNLVTSWNSIRGGGGLPPLNFTSGDVFVIQSPHNMGTAAAWTVSGAGSTIVVTDTTANQGSGTVAASVTRFYLSRNAGLDASATQLAGSHAVPDPSRAIAAISSAACGDCADARPASTPVKTMTITPIRRATCF